MLKEEEEEKKGENWKGPVIVVYSSCVYSLLYQRGKWSWTKYVMEKKESKVETYDPSSFS